MPLSLLNHSALALFAQRTRIPTSARSIGFCAIWVCISSSSNSNSSYDAIPNDIKSPRAGFVITMPMSIEPPLVHTSPRLHKLEIAFHEFYPLLEAREKKKWTPSLMMSRSRDDELIICLVEILLAGNIHSL